VGIGSNTFGAGGKTMYRYLLATLAQNAGFILENIGTTGSGTFFTNLPYL
jgi:hypothetical protein